MMQLDLESESGCRKRLCDALKFAKDVRLIDGMMDETEDEVAAIKLVKAGMVARTEKVILDLWKKSDGSATEPGKDIKQAVLALRACYGLDEKKEMEKSLFKWGCAQIAATKSAAS